MKRSIGRLLIICLVTLVFAAMLAGCGSKSVDGYYTFTTKSFLRYALEIHGDTATLHYSSAGKSVIKATVEKTDEGADLYFGESPSVFLNEWNDFNPMHVKLSDDGKKMYLSSDVNGWSAKTCEVITKKEFDEYINSF